MTLATMLAGIPYLEPLALDVSDDEGGLSIRMPFRRDVANYVGTMHAGALFTLAETAAGVAAHRVVPDGQAVVLLRGATVRYTRRAESDITATARVAPEAAEAARIEFDREQRGNAFAEVTMTDADGETVFEGTFDYALRPRTS